MLFVLDNILRNCVHVQEYETHHENQANIANVPDLMSHTDWFQAVGTGCVCATTKPGHTLNVVLQ